MNSFRGRRRETNTEVRTSSRNSPELDRLVDAQATLDDARRNAKWKRECKNLQSASHAVQVAALAAHDAGISWAEIGDVLGIERAMPHAGAATVTPEPTPPVVPVVPVVPVHDTVTELDPTRHRNHHVVTAAAQHFFPEQRQWATS